MDGSHYPYSRHSPQQYKKFIPEEDEDGINAYDNTLVYSDIYLNNHINFRKMRVTLRDGKTIVPFSKLEKSLQAPFIKRLPDDGKKMP
jgi:hypothetical protein